LMTRMMTQAVRNHRLCCFACHNNTALKSKNRHHNRLISNDLYVDNLPWNPETTSPVAFHYKNA
jgi:hypothetical protein